MKKLILIGALLSAFLTDAYSIKNKQDSIYYDLCLFLESKNLITKENIENNKENYSSLIYIEDILARTNTINKPNLSKKIGVFKFNYSGLMDGGYYILLINDKSYKVYQQVDISLIISELIKIKEMSPELLNDELFYKYLKEIIREESESMILSFKIGSIDYYIGKGIHK